MDFVVADVVVFVVVVVLAVVVVADCFALDTFRLSLLTSVARRTMGGLGRASIFTEPPFPT